MIRQMDVEFVKRAILRYGKHIFRTKAIARCSGLSTQYLKHIIPRLVESGFIRVYSCNGRYTLYERM